MSKTINRHRSALIGAFQGVVDNPFVGQSLVFLDRQLRHAGHNAENLLTEFQTQATPPLDAFEQMAIRSLVLKHTAQKQKRIFWGLVRE